MGKKLKSSDYVHLHNHTQYSLLDGLTKIGPLVKRVKEFGMESVAMTDHGTLSGTVEFYKECIASGVKPIIGLETYVANRSHTDKDPQLDKKRYHLIILAENNVGYSNLMKLSTVANIDGYYYYPRVDHELLEKYSEGLIVLSACMSGEVATAIKEDRLKEAEKIAQWYKKVFPGRYYLEIQDHGHPDNPLNSTDQNEINNKVIELGKKLDIPLVLTCDAHYLSHDDQEAHEVLLCVGTGSYLSDTNRMSLKDFPLHVEDPKALIKRWGDKLPEAITNTKAIADRCNVTLDLGQIYIPKFPVPKGETEASFLRGQVYKGLAVRYGNVSDKSAEKLDEKSAKKLLSKDILERAKYELDVINSMGFNGYFLIIWDFIKWGKDKGIVFGPGRGSAAGSIISYGLRITELDPIAYNLLFERFLNPDRISMPDIDIDIQDSRRDEVIKYCIDKYGSERVANIVTFGRMAARAAVRDVARVLQMPYAEADSLAKMIPPPVQGRHTPLEESIKSNGDLKGMYENSQSAKNVIDMAIRLEGTIRSHGVHAAGVVIAPDDIVKFVPLEMAQKGVVTTQYSMGPIEDLGLLKIDFLGLANLTIIKNALRIIRRVYGNDIKLSNIALDDEATFSLFQKGDTTGIFQFESAGMRRYLKQLVPTVFDDLIAMNALYRPGPMQWIEDFIARKNGLKNIEYIHDAMKPALENTYGIMVYQEQVMQIAKDMCGFSGGQADTLRKAIGKKKRDVMALMKKEFIDGAMTVSQVPKSSVEKLWTELEKFADYAFPKAHAACYALIAYWTAYLKAHYPDAFMAAVMTSDFDDTDRLSIEINECRRMGIEVLPPDINESFIEFAVVPKKKDEGQQIRFGLAAIKNVGAGAADEILKAREAASFISLEDFLDRVNSRIVNRKTMESLIKAGAFDRFANRHLMIDHLDLVMAYAAKLQKQKLNGQTDLFGPETITSQSSPLDILKADVDASRRDQLQWERELLGLYLSEHPLTSFEAYLRRSSRSFASLSEKMEGKTIKVGGAIQSVREITTKNGQTMAFIKLEDLDGEGEVILFPKIYQSTKDIWQRDKIVLVRGKLTARDRNGNSISEIKIIADTANLINEDTVSEIKVPAEDDNYTNNVVEGESSQPLNPSPKLYVRLKNSDNQDMLLSLKRLIDDHPGETDIILVLGDESDKQAIKLPTKVIREDVFLEKLYSLIGQENIKLT